MLIYGAKAPRVDSSPARLPTAPNSMSSAISMTTSILHGSIMGGLPIYDPTDLAALAVSGDIKGVLLALPNAARQRRNEILENMRKARSLCAPCRT